MTRRDPARARGARGRRAEAGVGLVEVMVALTILLLAALAVGNAQMSSLVAARASAIHFSIDRLGSDIIEVLRSQAADAAVGALDLPSSEVHAEVRIWSDRIAAILPSGEGRIDCDTLSCGVSISWMEEIDGTFHRQFYRTRTPL